MYTRTLIKYLTMFYVGTERGAPSTQLGTLLTNLDNKRGAK